MVQHSYRLQPPAALAGIVRPLLHPLSRLLPPQSGQQELRPASAPVVRAEPSGRGFRRDLRGLAAPALRLAQALRRLAGAQEARICRRADGARSRASGRSSRIVTRIDPISTAQRDAWPSTTSRSRRSTAMPTTTIYDRDLRRIFSDEPRHYRAPAASTFLRHHRARIRAHGREVDRRISAHARFACSTR